MLSETKNQQDDNIAMEGISTISANKIVDESIDKFQLVEYSKMTSFLIYADCSDTSIIMHRTMILMNAY